jgi:hypothetical protein
MAALVVIAGELPMALTRLNYFDADAFARQYTPLPMKAAPRPSKPEPIPAAMRFEADTRAAMQVALES